MRLANVIFVWVFILTTNTSLHSGTLNLISRFEQCRDRLSALFFFRPQEISKARVQLSSKRNWIPIRKPQPRKDFLAERARSHIDDVSIAGRLAVAGFCLLFFGSAKPIRQFVTHIRLESLWLKMAREASFKCTAWPELHNYRRAFLVDRIRELKQCIYCRKGYLLSFSKNKRAFFTSTTPPKKQEGHDLKAQGLKSRSS
jgi:hypothetical protein